MLVEVYFKEFIFSNIGILCASANSSMHVCVWEWVNCKSVCCSAGRLCFIFFLRYTNCLFGWHMICVLVRCDFDEMRYRVLFWEKSTHWTSKQTHIVPIYKVNSKLHERTHRTQVCLLFICFVLFFFAFVFVFVLMCVCVCVIRLNKKSNSKMCCLLHCKVRDNVLHQFVE